MSLIWKVGFISVSASQGGCEGLGELMQVQSLIAQPVVAPLLSTSKRVMHSLSPVILTIPQ